MFISGKSQRSDRANYYFAPGFSFLLCILMIGCGGSQLTPDEEARYHELQTERSKIAQKRQKMVRDVERAFKKSGDLERSKSKRAKRVLSCGYPSLQGQSLGPLPFKKRKGKSARFKKQGSKSGCTTYSMKVR